MISAPLAEIILVLVAVMAASLAIKLRPDELDAETRMQTAGAAGERRVARALDRARIPAVHDVTIRDRQGTHQIDHVAAAGDCLFVIETKAWRGNLGGLPDQPQWALKKPGRAPARVYNPIMQNATHADVVQSVTRGPVESMVLMAGHARMPGGFPEPILPMTEAIMRMMQAGPPSPRATAALAMIAGIKQAAGQSMMAGRHIQRMKRMKPTQSRQFWTLAGMATAACVWMLITHPTAGSF